MIGRPLRLSARFLMTAALIAWVGAPQTANEIVPGGGITPEPSVPPPLVGGSTTFAISRDGPLSFDSPTDTPAEIPGASPSPEPTPGPTLTKAPRPTRTDSPLACPDPPRSIAAAPLVYAGARNKKVVALTFDDGWSTSNTLKILAILEKDHVSATFFPVGRVIQLHPSPWRAVANAGFPIADHTWDHATLSRLCYAAQVSEMARQDAIVKDLLGVAPLPVVRPPGGSWNGATLVAAHATGQRDVVLWDVDTRDWSGPTAAVVAQRALAGRAGSIILMHASLPNTPAALPTIIAGYRARGFGFVTIGQLLGIGGAVPY
jgi:peptidoglycan-N-acetylglucosamine deacetylase